MAKARHELSMARDDDALLRLCTRWQRQYLAVEACGADDTLSDRRGELLFRTERQIAETPAQTPDGLLAKLAIHEHNLLMIANPEALDCTEQLALSLIADIRRLLERHRPRPRRSA